MKSWYDVFLEKAKSIVPDGDPSHDLSHVLRVVKNALDLQRHYGAREDVVLPAAFFHDFVTTPKDSPLRSKASEISATAACAYLKSIGYGKNKSPEFFSDIHHAIEAHSFSRGLEPRTLEAKIVQDADRLDALGYIGIARCFAMSGILRRPFFHEKDPFCNHRSPDDQKYTLDHFYAKLFKLKTQFHLEASLKEAEKRLYRMGRFIDGLKDELGYQEEFQPSLDTLV